MPVHDWSRVDAGTFHAFHLAWLGQLQAALNGGLLPTGFYALAEQHAGRSIPDMLSLHAGPIERVSPFSTGGTATITRTRPKVQVKLLAKKSPRQMRRTIAIRHVSGHRIIALLEVASPSNKDRRRSVVAFINKLTAALQLGIHVLLVDILPPGKYDPNGLHGALWSRFDPDDLYELPDSRSLTLASYAAALPVQAFVDHLLADEPLPDMPLFLSDERFVNVPLEPSYRTAYRGMPEYWREVIEGKRQPD